MEDCAHTATVICKLPIEGGGFQLTKQCRAPDCMRRVGNSLPQQGVDMDAVPLFDLEARDRVYAEEVELRRARWAASGEERQREYDEHVQRYNDYIISAAWRTKRRLVLDRDGYRCQICGHKDYLEVHHLTYAHLYDEHLFELVTLCASCHEQEYPRGRP